MSRRRTFAFTLIELLVVVAIIALLIAILLPSLGKAKKTANRAKCVANTRGMGQGVTFYVADYRNMFNYNGNSNDFWVNQLNRYVNLNKLRLCPEAKDVATAGSSGGVTTSWQGGSIVGNDPATGLPYVSSYGMNGWVQGSNPVSPYINQYNPAGVTADASWYWRLSDAKFSSEIPIFGDSIWYDGWARLASKPNATSSPPVPASYDNHLGRWQLNRHDMQIGMVFADGHAAPVKLKDLWSIRWHAHANDGSITSEMFHDPGPVPK